MGKSMKIIKLTMGHETMVDDEDFEYLNQWKWHVLCGKGKIYAASTIKINNKQTTIYLHQMILRPMPGYETDHLDSNGLNNCRGNLRYATHTQNNRNRKKRKSTTSIYKGVCWHRKKMEWRSEIRLNGTKKWLGAFYNEVDAALAYDRKAKELFGEFARTNF